MQEDLPMCRMCQADRLHVSLSEMYSLQVSRGFRAS